MAFMTSTVHVLPAKNGWAVKRQGLKYGRIFHTQKEAVQKARKLARGSASGQLVVYGRDGRIRNHTTYGMPKIPKPTGKSAAVIDEAVRKITIDRLDASPSPRG